MILHVFNKRFNDEVRLNKSKSPRIKGFKWEKERNRLKDSLTKKKLMGVREYTLFDKFDSINNIYSLGDKVYLDSLKSRIWTPSNLMDSDITIREIQSLIPTLIVADNPTEWTHLRRMISTMEYSQGPGRRIKFYVIDEVSGKILGLAEVSSDVTSIGVRDEFIGWTKDNKFKDGKLQSIAIGSTIIPCGVLGYNFLGGKLVSLLVTSDIVRKEWFKRYGDVLVGMTTTSVYGHRKKGGSQYSSLNPQWRTIGSTKGSVKIKPNIQDYNRCTKWLKKYFKSEYDECLSQSSPKQKVISLICRKLGIVQSSLEHHFSRGVYFSSFYKNTREFLRGEVDVNQLVERFNPSVEDLSSKWKLRAIKRYKSLLNQYKLKESFSYYSEIIGIDFDEVKEKFLPKPKVVELESNNLSKAV